MEETEAWNLWQRFDTAPTEAEAQIYREQLRPYLEARKAAGQPFFPTIRQQAQQQQQDYLRRQDEQFETLFADGWDAYVKNLPGDRQQTVNALMDGGNERTAMQQTMAVQAWIAARQGISGNRVAESYPVWLARAGKTLGMENVTLDVKEEPFIYGKLVEKYVNRRQENLMLNGQKPAEGRPERTGMVHAAVNAALDMQPGPEAFAAWQATAKTDKGYRSENAARYLEQWNEIYSQTRAKADPWRDVAQQTVATIMREMGREDAKDGEDIRNPAQLIAAAPKEARPLIMALLGKEAQKAGTGPEKGMAQQTGETFGRRITQMLGGSGRSLALQSLLEAQQTIKALQAGQTVTIDKKADASGKSIVDSLVTGRMASQSGLPGAEGGMAGIGSLLRKKEVALTPELVADAKAELERRIDAMGIEKDLQTLAEGKIDPVKPDNWFTRKIWYPAVDMGAFTTVALAGRGGAPIMVGGIADQRFDEYRQKYPDMKPADALMLAQTQGALETGIEYLQIALLKRSFKGLGAAFTAAQGNAAAMFGKAALRSAAEQNATEAVQDFTPMLLQSAASGLSQDIPGVDWTGEMTGFINSLGEREGGYLSGRVDVALALLPAIIVGAAGGTVQTKLRRDQLDGLARATTNERTMELAGLQPADRAAISAEKDTAARLDKFQDAYKRRDPEISKLALQRLAIEEDSRLVRAMPVMERTENGYTVDFGEGKRAEYADLETAQAARWEWVDAKGWQIVDETREALNLAEGALKIGTALDVRFDARRREIAQEVESGALTEAQAREAGLVALEAEGVQLSSEDKAQLDLASLRVLGSSETEFKEGVRRVIVRLYDGHSPLTVTEETTEDFAKQMLEGGQRGFLETALREFEQATGEKLLPADAAQTSDRHLIEAFSRVAVATLYGKSQAKDGPLPSWRGAMKGKLAGMVKALGAFLRAVFRRAMAIKEARTSGKLEGLALPDLIDQSLGLDAQTRYDRAVGAEAATTAAATFSAVMESRAEQAPALDTDRLITFSVVPADLEHNAALRRPMSFAERLKNEYAISPDNNIFYRAGRYYRVISSEAWADAQNVGFFRPNPETGKYDKLYASRGATGSRYRGRYIVEIDPAVSGKWETVDGNSGYVRAEIGSVRLGEGTRVFEQQETGTYSVVHDGIKDEAFLPAAPEVAKTGGEKSFSTLPAADIPDALTEMFSPFHGDPKARREIGNLMQDRVFQFARQWQAASARMPLGKDLDAEARRRQAEGFEKRMAAMDPNLAQAMGLTPEDIKVASQPVAYAILNDIGKMQGRAAALRSGASETGGEYDGAGYLPPALFWGGNLRPDQVSQQLHDMGLLKDAYPDTMWQALDKEMRTVARRREEYEAATAFERRARRDSRKEAADWLAQAKAAKAQDFRAADRERLLAGMRTLDAILSALPGEVRAKVGGTAKLAELQTDASRLDYIQTKIERISRVLEAWLRQEIGGQFEQLLRDAQPKGDKGEKIKGKIGAEGHAWFAEVERIARMPAEAVDQRRGEIEAALNQPDTKLTPEQQDALVQEWLLLGTFGNFSNLTSAEMESALQDAEEVYQNGRQGWLAVLQQRREERGARAADAIRENGGPFTRGTEDAQAGKAETKRGAAARLMQGFIGQIYSFGQTMGILFGDGATRRAYEVRMNKATREKRAAMLRREADFQRALGDAYGAKSRLERQRVLYDLQQQHDETGVFFYDVQAKKEKIDVEAAQRIVDGTMTGHGLKPYEVMELKWLLDENNAKKANERRDKLELTRVYRGKPAQKRLSRAQAMHVRMLWAMEEYHPSLARDGIGADTIEQIDAFLRPEDHALMAYLAGEYEAGYERINAPFRRLYGVNLPRVRNYAPGTFQHDGDVKSLLPGEQELSGNMGAGFLRRRKNHAARMNLTMVDNVIDALSVYWRHVAETEHWIAFAELGDEMKSVFNRREVREAVRVNSGASAAEHLNKWVEVAEKDGIRQGWANLQTRRILNHFMAARSKVALGYKVSVWLKQATAALATAFDLPAKEFAKSFIRVATGNGALSREEAMNLPIMQQRLASGSSPEWRMAMQEQARRSRPGMLTAFTDAGMVPIGWFDALFTGFSAAVAYDAHYRMAKDMGLTEEQARAEAEQRADTSVARTAQPVETTDKSLWELGMQPLSKVLFMFMSEARQKTALEFYAIQQAFAGKGSLADIGKVVFLNHVIFGTATWVLGSLWRDMTNDDDEGGADDPAWELSDWLFSMLTGPLAGLPLAGDIFSGFAELLTGHHGFQKDSNPVAVSVTDIAKGVNQLFDEDAKKGEEVESALRRAGSAVQAISQVIGGDWAGVGSGVNLLKQVAEVGDNFVETAEEGKTKAERQKRKDKREAKKQ